ncbi:MAG: CRISPR-associated endonuclease Cas1, partial [Pseudomonadota bacterium]
MSTIDLASTTRSENVLSAASWRWAARQRVLYVLQPGRLLTAEGESFVVREDDAALLRLAPHRVDRIEVGRQIRLDEAALDLAAATDTVLLRTDGWGRALGRWTPAGSGRARRQLAQAAVVLDPARRLELARSIVEGRILSQRTLLK